MIRFLDLTQQIWPKEEPKEDRGEFGFAWYETITEKILSFNGENVWSSWDYFEYDLLHDPNKLYVNQLDRFKSLFMHGREMINKNVEGDICL